MSSSDLPRTQRAVELVGPDQLRLNPAKPVPPPGAHQVLCRVEAVGLCFSDLKLVQQFAAHPRKSEVISGVDREVLARLPSYVPGELPTSPGHEAVVRVAAVGDGVTAYRLGERYLIQADYRWLPTARANAAFGYNFAGALQEYVLFDERVIISPEGECALIPVSESPSASALALVEPWACVEHAYASPERQGMKGPEGRRALCAEAPSVRGSARPYRIPLPEGGLRWSGSAAELRREPDQWFDDIAYLGGSADKVERLFPKLAPGGILYLALGGGRFHRPVSVPVGRVHYQGIRIAGTVGSAGPEVMAHIPPSAEIRPGNRVHIVGAGGPMGVMHVVRALSSGVPGIQVFAGDTDESRLAALARLAAPLAEKHGVAFQTYNPTMGPAPGPFDYLALMVPAPALVAEAAEQAAEGAIINLFAGIPAEVSAALDLNAYLEKHCYLTGTSGSEIRDMKTVLHKLERGLLDTNLSVAAVGGLEAGIEGIRSIERREIAGKIVLYPACRELPLIRLNEMQARLPEVAALLRDGTWTPEAERALLQAYETERPKR